MKHIKLILLSCFITSIFTAQPVLADEFSDPYPSDAPASDAPFSNTSSSDASSSDNPENDNTQVFHMADNINLVTTIKFQYGVKPKLFVKSVFPLIDNELGDDNLEAFNESVNSMIKQIIAEFKNQAIQNASSTMNLPKESNKNNLYIDYAASFINSGDDPILSVRFTMQGFFAGMAHPYTIHRVLNFDLATGQKIELNNLFLPDANYLDVLSKYTSKRLSKRLKNKELIAMGAGPAPENFNYWNIKPNGILITFDEATVAPRVYGAQTVLVPYAIIRSIISPNAPIAGCVAHAKKCSQSNTLTGGFIDEAANTHHGRLNPALG